MVADTETDHPLLFEGEYMPSSRGFSYETLLMRDCPEQFKNPYNAWTAYAGEIYCDRRTLPSFDSTDWKLPICSERRKQIRCFDALLRATQELNEPTPPRLMRRVAVLGWMLHEMLVSIPEKQPVLPRLLGH